MSEPVSNAEIEDVLSSIRRLVSEDTRTTIRSRVEEEPSPAAQDRLVLTPSLRVTSDEPEQVPAEDQAEQMFDVAPDLVEPDAEADLDKDTAADLDKEEVSAKPWSDPDATLYEAAAHADVEPDVEDAGETDAHEAEPELQSSDDEAWSDDAPEEPEAVSEVWHEDAQDEEDTSEYQEPEDVGLAGAVEAVGAAMAETENDQWEPHGDETPDINVPETEPLEWQDDDGEADDLSAPTVTYMDDDFDEDADDVELFADDEAVLDEATLRELVTDIVREELQGALGERITRNVRKLVRREINRALSVQDLE